MVAEQCLRGSTCKVGYIQSSKRQSQYTATVNKKAGAEEESTIYERHDNVCCPTEQISVDANVRSGSVTVWGVGGSFRAEAIVLGISAGDSPIHAISALQTTCAIWFANSLLWHCCRHGIQLG